MLSEDVTLDHLRLGRFGDVSHAGREDGIAVVDLAVFGQEADQVLPQRY